MSKDSSGSVMIAFVVGALAGAAVALLFAPASGEETREYLGKKAREGTDKAREAMDQGREYYEHQRENLVTAVDRGRDAFQQARERGDQA
ncbi:MAG: YtxH domain-containing protein [Acidobacteria bacterium]|nr:YtxH domain-containing protein [Acidobacteriota bacterium]MSO63197.1 YtxH domain-containing protein [Acidobacteriota bacterium]